MQWTLESIVIADEKKNNLGQVCKIIQESFEIADQAEATSEFYNLLQKIQSNYYNYWIR